MFMSCLPNFVNCILTPLMPCMRAIMLVGRFVSPCLNTIQSNNNNNDNNDDDNNNDNNNNNNNNIDDNAIFTTNV